MELDLEILQEAHPLAYVGGVLGALLGYYSVRVMEGDSFAIGEASYHVGIIWKILTPLATGVVCFFVTNKILSE